MPDSGRGCQCLGWSHRAENVQFRMKDIDRNMKYDLNKWHLPSLHARATSSTRPRSGSAASFGKALAIKCNSARLRENEQEWAGCERGKVPANQTNANQTCQTKAKQTNLTIVNHGKRNRPTNQPNLTNAINQTQKEKRGHTCMLYEGQQSHHLNHWRAHVSTILSLWITSRPGQ